MKRYAVLYAGLLAVLLVLFALVEVLDVPLLTDRDPLDTRAGPMAALIGVALLVVDVVLPVPSSVVMVAHGALFGVVAGTALSIIGSLGGFTLGLALGRRGAALVARAVPEEERLRADRLVRRWGLVAIILSRPVPLVAETVAIAAGVARLRWSHALGAAALGSLPAAVVYAVAGALSATFATGAVVFIVVVVLALAAAVFVRSSRLVAVGAP